MRKMWVFFPHKAIANEVACIVVFVHFMAYHFSLLKTSLLRM